MLARIWPYKNGMQNYVVSGLDQWNEQWDVRKIISGPIIRSKKILTPHVSHFQRNVPYSENISDRSYFDREKIQILSKKVQTRQIIIRKLIRCLIIIHPTRDFK